MDAPGEAKRDRFFAALAAGPQLMGIVNITPDSFSDGGRFQSSDTAVAEAKRHAAGGAAIIDVGAESTRPGFVPVAVASERARLLPVLAAVIGAVPIAVSIDTTKAAIAAEALVAGVVLVNDQWGLQGDPDMGGVVARNDAGLIMMHNRVETRDGDIVDDMHRFFDTSIKIAERAGIRRDRLILDPGIGFGKTKLQNLRALGAGVAALRATYGLPVLVGASRKSLFAALVGASAVHERLPGTLAAHLAARAGGASLFRVHDCREHRDAFAVADAIAGAARDG